ncbi:MAG: hypothetical protein AAGB29_07045 [Planctomycetota bacterium]
MALRIERKEGIEGKDEGLSDTIRCRWARVSEEVGIADRPRVVVGRRLNSGRCGRAKPGRVASRDVVDDAVRVADAAIGSSVGVSVTRSLLTTGVSIGGVRGVSHHPAPTANASAAAAGNAHHPARDTHGMPLVGDTDARRASSPRSPGYASRR